MEHDPKLHDPGIHGSEEHISTEQWTHYIQDRLPAALRDTYEAHLYDCDQCLSVYIKCVDQMADILPFVNGPVEATKRKRSASILRNSLFQYSIAACITLLLLTTGVFQSLLTQLNYLSSETSSSSQGTVSSAIVDKAASLIGEWPINPERGNMK